MNSSDPSVFGEKEAVENPRSQKKYTVSIRNTAVKGSGRLVKRGRPAIEEDPIVLLELRAQGFSWPEIADAMGHNRESLRLIAGDYLGRAAPRTLPDQTPDKVMIRKRMLDDLRTGWRPKREQLLYYDEYLQKGWHKPYFEQGAESEWENPLPRGTAKFFQVFQ